MTELAANIIIIIVGIVMFIIGFGGVLVFANRAESLSERIAGLVMGSILCAGAVAFIYFLKS